MKKKAGKSKATSNAIAQAGRLPKISKRISSDTAYSERSAMTYSLETAVQFAERLRSSKPRDSSMLFAPRGWKSIGCCLFPLQARSATGKSHLLRFAADN
jgi:hypothetical protein